MAANDYSDVNAVVAHLLDTSYKDGDKYEAIITALITRASRLIDTWFGYPEGHFAAAEVPVAKYFDGSGTGIMRPGDMAAAPTVVEVAEAGILTDYTEWSATDYLLSPYNALEEGRPYRELIVDAINGTKSIWYRYPKSVKITCRWGWSVTTPDTIEEACIVQTARWFHRGLQAFQDAGAVTELYQMRYLKKIDPEVELLLNRMPGGITI